MDSYLKISKWELCVIRYKTEALGDQKDCFQLMNNKINMKILIIK